MAAQENSRIFENQPVVFTGKLASLSRREAQAVVVRHGGLTPARVTKETALLVIGEEGFLSDIVKSNKLKRAEELNAQGGAIRIIPESEFLQMAGLEGKAELEKKYYSLERIQRLYPRLRTDIIRYLAHWGVFKPAVKTNAQQYYEFKDLLIFRRLNELLAQKIPLRALAKYFISERTPSPQLDLAFEESRPKGVVLSLQRPAPEPARTAEDWYEIGFHADGNPETYEQAVSAYENALAINPNYVDAMINLANIYFHKQDYPRAVQLLEKAISLDGENYLVCYNLANLYDELGVPEKAAPLYHRSLMLFPNYEPALFNLAVVYEKIGRHEEAKPYWQKYLAIEPEGEWAAIAKEHLMEASG